MPTFSTVGHALQFGNGIPTVTIVGTDTDGYIIYDMSPSGTFYQFAPNTKYFAIQVIFDTPLSSIPGIVINPANSGTAQMLTAIPGIEFFVDQADVTVSYFKISGISASTPLLGPQVLVWSYQVGGASGGGGGGGSGTVTSITAASPLTGGTITTSGTIGLPKATSSTDGYLLHNDWTTFNNKGSGSVTSVATTSRLTGGPITTSGTLDLAISGVSAGTKNGLTFDAYGRITASPTGHLTADGYTIDISGGALTNQVLQYNGTSFVAANSGSSTNLQQAYTNGTASLPQTVQLSSANEGIIVDIHGNIPNTNVGDDFDIPQSKLAFAIVDNTILDAESQPITYFGITGNGSLVGRRIMHLSQTIQLAGDVDTFFHSYSQWREGGETYIYGGDGYGTQRAGNAGLIGGKQGPGSTVGDGGVLLDVGGTGDTSGVGAGGILRADIDIGAHSQTFWLGNLTSTAVNTSKIQNQGLLQIQSANGVTIISPNGSEIHGNFDAVGSTEYIGLAHFIDSPNSSGLRFVVNHVQTGIYGLTGGTTYLFKAWESGNFVIGSNAGVDGGFRLEAQGTSRLGGNCRIDGYASPGVDDAYSLGDSTHRWKDGYFGGKIVLDGYSLDLSGNATTNQALVYNGTSFVGSNIANSVSNSDSTLTISPTTGSVIASLNLAHANTWSAKQTFSAHIAVDGYTIDLSANATTNQVLQYNGTSFVATSSVPVRQGNASETQLTTTGATDVISFTTSNAGNYTAFVYYRVVTGTTNLTLVVTWTDVTGAQTQTIVPAATPQLVGSYTNSPIYINTTNSSAVKVTATAGTANQIFVSASVIGIT